MCDIFCVAAAHLPFDCNPNDTKDHGIKWKGKQFRCFPRGATTRDKKFYLQIWKNSLFLEPLFRFFSFFFCSFHRFVFAEENNSSNHTKDTRQHNTCMHMLAKKVQLESVSTIRNVYFAQIGEEMYFCFYSFFLRVFVFHRHSFFHAFFVVVWLCLPLL